jgi:hypothetical protein
MVATQGPDQGGGYAFAQQPRAVSGRSKYRDPAATDDRLAVCHTLSLVQIYSFQLMLLDAGEYHVG